MVTLVTRGIIFPLFGRVKTHLYRKIGTGCDLHRTEVLNNTDQTVLRHMSVFRVRQYCFANYYLKT